MIAESGAVWFGHEDAERLFYPFGIKRKGYSVPDGHCARIVRWTQWRAQLPLVLLTLYFLPLVEFWGPTLSASGRLEPKTLAVALALLFAAALASAWLVDRAAYAWLLRGCAPLDRVPTRMEQKTGSGQVRQSFANRNSAPLPVRLLCLAVGLITIIRGLGQGDGLLMLSGGLLSAVFALNVVKDCCHRIHLWLLYDISRIKGGDH